MNKIIKSILCFSLILALCITGAGFALAADTDTGDSDFSSQDLSEILSILSETGEEGGVQNGVEYTVGPVVFAVPSTWTTMESLEEMEQENYTFMAPNFMTYAMAIYGSYSELGGDDIPADPKSKIHNEDFLEQIYTSFADLESEPETSYVTVAGEESLWFTSEMDQEGLTMMMNGLVVPFDEGIFVFVLGDVGGVNANTFLSIVDSVHLEGGSPETDLSAVTDEEIIPFNIVDEPEEGDSLSGLSALLESAGDEQTGNEPVTKPEPEEVPSVAGEEIVLIDDDICKVSILGFDDTDSWYPLIIGMHTENKTDLNLDFSMNNISVNGYMCSPWWSETLEPGAASDSQVEFYSSDLTDNMIESVKDIEFTIVARDDDDWGADYLEEQTFIVYPFDDHSEQAPQEFEDDDIVLVDNDDIRVIITGFEATDLFFIARVYLENNTGSTLTFTAGDGSTLNGAAIKPSLYIDVAPGKKANTSLMWYMSDLRENNIEQVEEIELVLNARDADDWFSDPVLEELFTIPVE